MGARFVGSKPSVAFVVQRCGDDVIGGAESLCLQIAGHISAHYNVEVLTTCARDYMTWRNVYPPGHTHVGDVHVQRFPVDRARDVDAFNRLSERIRDLGDAISLEEQEAWMQAQGPTSSALRSYVQLHAPRFDAFAFFSYLYATTYEILPMVAEKATLWPFAHDEWMLKMSLWDRLFALPRRIVLSSHEEAHLIRQRFPTLGVPTDVIPTGVAPMPGSDAARFRSTLGIDGPFALYLGRIDASKGCDTLVNFFRRYAQGQPVIRKLVLAGDQQMPLSDDRAIVVAGALDERTKWDALAAASVVIIPSALESLSLVVLEAWAAGRPVLVNAASPVLVGQCRRANGGVWYAGYDEFAAALDLLAGEAGAKLGMQGRAFVSRQYLWEDAVEAYRRVFAA